MADRALPKSLHTITVLENLARNIMSEVDPDTRELIGDKQLREAALKSALKVLKLDAMPDPHQLEAATLKKLEAKA